MVMSWGAFWKMIWEEREWVFSGIGITVLTTAWVIVKSVWKKKPVDKTGTHEKVKKNSENTISGGQNIVGNNNNITHNDNSNVNTVIGSGNVTGSGNNVTNNYYYANNDTEERDKSWFSERFDILLANLNQARRFGEKEYTVEYVSSLIGLKNVDELKVYLIQSKEPDDEFKRKFVNVFGVNEEWMVYNRGEFAFAPNLSFSGNNPMDILRTEDIKSIDKFILVVGDVAGSRMACVIRKKGDLCYELYPKFFTLNSCVGGAGTRNLVELYRFIREADRIKKLDAITYKATEEQMTQLMKGAFSPKMIELFEVARGFIEDFLCISDTDINRNQRHWDEEFISVQKIIAANIKEYDEINQKNDLEIISKKLKNEEIEEAQSVDIDMFDHSTTFFSYRFGKAFPGVRGIMEYDNPKECVERLGILLKNPLSGKKLRGPIWWFRGSSNLDIGKFEKVSEDKFLIDGDEIKVKRIVVYSSPEYYKKFVYVETVPEEPTGLYEHNEEFIEQWKREYGYYNEEYAVYQGNKIKRTEYDDGAAVIDGKVVDLNGKAELRIRYITPYNFVICAQFNPINNNNYDNKMVVFLNGILQGKNTVEDIVKFVDLMPRDRRDLC